MSSQPNASPTICGSVARGGAEARLDTDGKLTIDLNDGLFKYGVVLEANAMGSWKSLDGSEGFASGALAIRGGGYELIGKWHEEGTPMVS
jgi:hypothetical protein